MSGAKTLRKEGESWTVEVSSGPVAGLLLKRSKAIHTEGKHGSWSLASLDVPQRGRSPSALLTFSSPAACSEAGLPLSQHPRGGGPRAYQLGRKRQRKLRAEDRKTPSQLINCTGRNERMEGIKEETSRRRYQGDQEKYHLALQEFQEEKSWTWY